ncbi:reverse transcriptase domain-containing protein [Tanacetum coccineum]
MLKRYEETNLVLNWEKCHFMVKEGIVLGHKVSGSGIEVDKAKIKAFSKLPYPTNVKAIRSFLGHAGFYRRFIKDFSQIARPMTQLLVKDAPFNFSEECIQAFDKLKRELTQAPIMIKPDWSLPFKIMCDAKFDIKIRDKKGDENLAADHLSRLEYPDLGKLTKAEIRDLFLEERLMTISDKNNEPCPSYSNNVLTESYKGAWPEMRQHKFFDNVTADHLEDIMASPPPQEKSLRPGFTCHISSEMHACHLPVKLEHKAYWAIKNYNLDLMKARENHFLQINKLDEMRLDAYETSISYKERTKRWHDKRIKVPTNYEKGDKVLLFNSCLRLFPGKLKSRWYEPFLVCKDMKNDAIELYDEDGNGFIEKSRKDVILYRKITYRNECKNFFIKNKKDKFSQSVEMASRVTRDAVTATLVMGSGYP